MTGSMVLDDECDQTGGTAGDLGKFILDKGKGDKAATQKIVGKELCNHFKDGPVFHYNTPLNK